MTTKFVCTVCQKDLQSAVALAEHKLGIKHQKKSAKATGEAVVRTRRFPRLLLDDFVGSIARGKFRNIVVCTGAGVSTASGIADFRSKGGVFEQIRKRWGHRFPELHAHPELVLSRRFVCKAPDVWRAEVKPWLDQIKKSVEPSKAHKMCALLAKKGWLRRVYTQNVDGLHTHESLDVDPDLVVQCHGSIERNDIVLYDDSLPACMFDALQNDFGLNESGEFGELVDLVLVLGTSLKVRPFCGIPNLAPKTCARAWITRDPPVNDNFRKRAQSCRFVKGRGTTVLNLFGTSKGAKKWPQAVFDLCCEEFAQRLFDAMETHTQKTRKKEV